MTRPADPLRQLQVSARRYGRLVLPGSDIRRVIVLDAAGHKVADVAVPPGDDTPERGPDPEVQPGWDFAGNVPLFDGRPVPIAGRGREVLKVLAEADGPVTTDQLREAVWAGYDASDSAIRFQVVELRKKLLKAFPGWEGDPVPASGAGFELAIR